MPLEFDCEFSYPSGFHLALAFRAEEGVTGLCGPSGAGKTTVLNLIAGVLRPCRGTIRLRDRILFDSQSRTNMPLHRRRFGYVFQDFLLFPHLTVDNNLKYGARRTKAPAADFSRLLEILELGPLLDRYPKTLSGGEQQRVALGRAIATGSQFLLLDEPVSALDAGRKSGVLDYLEALLREFRTSALIVSHDASSLERLGAKRISIGDMSK
jgi:molybdate transport system ATP-binding protein